MPELKNTFLEGKMNKDLDARLLKNGEYFDAQNIHITKSEGSDMGTVQNILGNKLNYTVGAFKNRTQTIGELKVGTPTIGIVTTNTSDGTNAAGAGYSGTPGTTSGWTTNGNGIGGNFTIKISGGAVTSVIINAAGKGYKIGDTITISKDVGTPAIGGSTSVVLTLRAEDMSKGSAAEIVTTNTTDGTNAAGAGYSGTPGVTSGFLTNGNGTGGTVNIIIDNNTVTQVTLSGSASGYKVGDTITISKTQGTPAIGGSTSVVLTLREEDLLITEDIGNVIGYFADSEAKSGVYTIYYFVKGNSSHKDNIYYYQESVTAPIPLINNESDFLKFSSDFLITGVNIIDDLLFWTDDKNQPRKINTVTAKADNTYYDNEDKISVAKYYPYTPPKVLRQVDGTDHCGMQKLKTEAKLLTQITTATKTIEIVHATAADGDPEHNIHVGQEIYHGTTFLGKVDAISADGNTITCDTNITSIAAGQTLTFLNQNDKLRDKFVRFAYRFKFKDGEYSLISPFTQHCFIPQTYNVTYGSGAAKNTNTALPVNDAIGLTSAQRGDAAKTTELASFINDVGHVNLQIEFPSDEPTKDFEIEKIEILIKESNRPDIKSLAQLDITDSSVGTDKIYEYTYKGTLPYKTLPERQLTRVYDNVPVRAKAQELIGNRIVYGNYQENPNNKPYDNDLGYSFDYHLSTGIKNDTEFKFDKQYPYHSIKTRRTYQVGLVLVDRYGRQSPVFLSDDVNNSILKVKAKSTSETSGDFAGEVMEISFNKVIPSSDSESRSVLYSSTNPTGWYSYKVVVKQNEQDYYNVYAPSAYDNFPNANTLLPNMLGGPSYYTDEDKRTWIVLHGDNINKVPRDTTEGSTEENSIFPTDVDLFPKVLSAGDVMSGDPLVDIISVGKALDHGLEDVTFDSSNLIWTDLSYLFIFNRTKNPLVAELPDGYGVNATFTKGTSSPFAHSYTTGSSNCGFSVWETKPFESSLDIYYETVTCGLISTLNSEILEFTAGALPTSIVFDDADEGTTTSFAEGLDATTNGQAFGPNLKTKDQTGTAITTGLTYSIVSVLEDGNYSPPLQTTGDTHFGISEDGNNYKLKITNNEFYYGTSGHTYTVRVKAVNTANQSVEQDFTVNLTNSKPTIVLPDAAAHAHFNSNGVIFQPTTAVNGSADTDQDNLNLTYTIKSVTYDPSGANETTDTHKNKFTVNSTTGVVSANNHNFPDSEVGKIYKVTVEIDDNSSTGEAIAKHDDFCEVTIGGWFWGNFLFASGGENGVCGAVATSTPFQDFYIKRPVANTSTQLIPIHNDEVYSNAALTTVVNSGAVITVPLSDGFYTTISGGKIQDVDEPNNC